MELNQQLKVELMAEKEYQQQQNETQNESYRQASLFHQQQIAEKLQLAEKYPQFLSAIIQQHIASEETIFGQETEHELTVYEKGRIYSLVRFKHMLRIAKEKIN